MVVTKSITKSKKHFSMILVPVVTEKTALVGQGGECVVFEVSKAASKLEIREAVEAIYSVKVAAVNTVNVFGKPKRGLRRVVHRQNVKKAYVTLVKGQTISVVEGV